MNLRLDHVVIYVPDLERAITDYTGLGFQVERGGAHTRTENALISFADGTYLELLALKPGRGRPLIQLASQLGLMGLAASRKTDMYWRLLRWISSGAGIVDWCAATPDIEATLKTWGQTGLALLGYQEFERRRPDGKIARWFLGSPKTMALPFLIQDISERDIRVPAAGPKSHPNDALGIVEIILSVPNPQKAQMQYAELGLTKLGQTHIRFEQKTGPKTRIRLMINYDGQTQELNPL